MKEEKGGGGKLLIPTKNNKKVWQEKLGAEDHSKNIRRRIQRVVGERT